MMGAMAMFAPYDIENVKIDGYDVVVNKPKTAAYRAPGAPAAVVRHGAADRRARREAGHGPAGAAAEERLARGHARTGRDAVPARSATRSASKQR